MHVRQRRIIQGKKKNNINVKIVKQNNDIVLCSDITITKVANVYLIPIQLNHSIKIKIISDKNNITPWFSKHLNSPSVVQIVISLFCETRRFSAFFLFGIVTRGACMAPSKVSLDF